MVCREKNMGTVVIPKLGEDLIQTNDWSGVRRPVATRRIKTRCKDNLHLHFDF